MISNIKFTQNRQNLLAFGSRRIQYNIVPQNSKKKFAQHKHNFVISSLMWQLNSDESAIDLFAISDFTEHNLYWIKGALFVCFSFWLRVLD